MSNSNFEPIIHINLLDINRVKIINSKFVYNDDTLTNFDLKLFCENFNMSIYENSKSIKLKAEFVKQNDGAGLIIWEVSGDAIEKKTGSGIIDSTPLVDAINDSFVIPRKKRIPRRIQKPKIEKVKKEKGWRSKAIKDNLDKLYKP